MAIDAVSRPNWRALAVTVTNAPLDLRNGLRGLSVFLTNLADVVGGSTPKIAWVKKDSQRSINNNQGLFCIWRSFGGVHVGFAWLFQGTASITARTEACGSSTAFSLA